MIQILTHDKSQQYKEMKLLSSVMYLILFQSILKLINLNRLKNLPNVNSLRKLSC